MSPATARAARQRDQEGLHGCRVVTTSASARLLLLGQLEGFRDYSWTLVSGDDYEDAPDWVAVHVIPMRRDPAWSDARSFWRLLMFFGRHDFKFVQTHTPKASLLALPAARLRGAVTLYTVHGSLYFRGNTKARNLFGWLFERWCCSWATKVLVQSSEDLTVLPAKHICRAAKMVYVGNGIALDRFPPQSPPKAGGPVVLMVSRLVKEKGCYDFFEVARSLRPWARFIHVGPSEHDQRDAIGFDEQEEARRTGVEFAGEVDDVGSYLAGADIVLLPSYREGIPRVAMEAAAVGRPVVGYDIRGMREVISEGFGLLAPLGDISELIGITRRLLDDSEYRAVAGERCKRWVRSAFSEADVIDRLRAVYAGLDAD